VFRLAAAIVALAVALNTASAAQAKYGGVLVVGQANGAPTGLDPSLPHSGGSQEILDTICQGMYAYDKKQNLVPQLAASMPAISPDKLTYTIQLRQGILFNDGTPFNAQAVVTTFNRAIGLNGQSPLYSATAAATGPYTVVFHLSSRYSPFLQSLTQAIESPAQLAKLGDNFGSDPICVGPFMYDSQVAGTSVTVIKSPYYYARTAVHLDKIVFRTETSTAVAAADLEAGDIQAVDNLNAGDLPGIQGQKNLSLIQSPVDGDTDLIVNLANANGLGNPPGTVSSPLAQSPKLLQAFEEAIDRNALARVLAPVAVPGCTFVPPLSAYYDPALECTPYDPADARKLVAASGIPNPTVHLLTPNLTRQLLIAQFLQSEEAAVGINVSVDVQDFGAVAAAANAGNFQVVCTFGYKFADAGSALLGYDRAPDNLSGFTTPQLSLILANYVKSTSAQSQRTLVDTAQQILLNARPIIVLYHVVMFLAYSSSLTGIQAVNGAFYRIAFAQYSG
jgi:peptide/nickel transport system substrate-binding protein